MKYKKLIVTRDFADVDKGEVFFLVYDRAQNREVYYSIHRKNVKTWDTSLVSYHLEMGSFILLEGC